MIKFIDKPNLPSSDVNCVICGELCRELNDYLDSRSVERVFIKPNNNIDPAVRYHADMAAIHLGNNKILIDKNQAELSEVLLNKGFDVYFSDSDIKGEYPFDIPLNFILLKNKIIGKTACADKNLLDLTNELTKINVRQGYSKCSCLIVNENAVITDDESISKALKAVGVDALLISKGDILLNGHDYGFIGGASCKLSEKEILFFGDITKHKDYKKIAEFIEKHGCKISYLDFSLTDFGGIIPITEKAP